MVVRDLHGDEAGHCFFYRRFAAEPQPGEFGFELVHPKLIGDVGVEAGIIVAGAGPEGFLHWHHNGVGGSGGRVDPCLADMGGLVCFTEIIERDPAAFEGPVCLPLDAPEPVEPGDARWDAPRFDEPA